MALRASGCAQTSEIIMFMTQDALNRFTVSEGRSIGADAAITVISGGASEASTLRQHRSRFSDLFLQSKGLIGDLSA
jgi:hypothetical protein